MPEIVPLHHRATCHSLRAKYPRFVYESFSVDAAADRLRVKFHFRIEPDIDFSPETIFENVDAGRLASLPAGVLENLVFHIGLVEMLSYWKATCSPQILVRAGSLDSQQIGWWMDLLEHGMGEFFYVNQIDFREPDFVRILAESPRGGMKRLDTESPGGNRDLVLTSGGKDSAVTLELLREAGRSFDCLLLNPTPAALALARQSGCISTRIIRRSIDPRLLELNAAGFLNGHTPFSALLAFLGVTAAVISGSRRVIVSNERSAEEASAGFLGREVNHQYTKSLRFETAFRDYTQKYLAPGVEYFSLLRPLYELQIAALFAQRPQYFPLFRSCNRNIASNTWCGDCPKCLFVFTALYPFLEREQMLSIFGGDLLAREGALAHLRAMAGLDAHKPFECVGTTEETLVALYLCAEKYKQQGIELPPALKSLNETVPASQSGWPARAQRVLHAWTDEHHLPADLAGCLRERTLQ